MEEFPSEIEQLTGLRMLDLSNSRIKTTLPNILCKLTKIEELYMGHAIINWEVESSSEKKTNASLSKLSHLICLTTLEIQVSEAWLLPKDIPFDKLERYKIVIGDKWEWLNNKETLRLLKVKLDTSIRGERGIKTLIERVEDLYLDKISGISNVLFELNGEGFPLLKHLHIQNNGEIQHITNSMKRNQTQALFPKLETLILQNLNNLVKICRGPVRNNSFGQLKFVKVKSCDQLICPFSVSVVQAFSHLVEIEVSECNSMTNIVSLENAESGKIIDDNIEFVSLHSLTLKHLPIIYNFYSHELMSLLRTKQGSLQANTPTAFFSAKVKFSNLKTLKLSSVNLKTIWDDKTPCLMENLANLTVEDCSGLKYLFPSSMIGKLSNLKQLGISKCDTMEKIVAIDEKYGVAPAQVLFPKLEAIIIKDMQNLKMIWQPILASNSLACFKTLEVKNCEKIDKIFPNYMNGALATLEKLKVQGCMSVEEIFQLDVDADDTTQLKYITLLRLPQLKQIWSKGSQSSLRFKNLKVVRVEDCDDLEYLFPFSITMNLPLLEQITIMQAKRIKEIVSEREEPLDDLVEFEFNQLTSVVLWNLQNLQGFCAGNHSLSCSSLKKLDVRTQGTSSQRRLLHDNLHVSMKQPLFTLEEVAFRGFECLELSRYPELGDVWLWDSDVKHEMFELRVSECDSLEALIELPNMNEGRMLVEKETIHLKRIYLSCLPEFKHIWKRNSQEIVSFENFEEISFDKSLELHTSKIQGFRETTEKGDSYYPRKQSSIGEVLLPKLETIIIEDLQNLETIWHPVLTLNSMGSFETLKVKKCQKIQHIFPIYMNEVFAALQTLKVKDCNSVQEIFQLGAKEMCSRDDKSRLKNIILLRLPKLKQIWSTDCQSSLHFKSLQVVRVEYCGDLEYLFPFSIAKHLPQLEAITIKSAEKMKEIVSKREEPLDNLVKFEFNQLTSMVLWNLHDLQRFCAGNHSLSCSSLKALGVYNCQKLKLFKTQDTSNQERLSDDNLYVSMQQPLFTLEEI
ncbi:uncharacterized protein LOC114737244 [Neltuma alba]|uniref:uncharacterized protein LOC114737244 n=1 Tax=Neltuma alba TaxID=207710 RepID=UPI0010A49E45|nr:uncharacterized protein LOC114737244 [Prosopis alba]